MSLESKPKSSSEQIERVQDSPVSVSEKIAIQNETFAINQDALGTHLSKGYYYSPRFIGTVVVCQLQHSYMVDSD